MIPNVYRIARLHGATADVALLAHRLIRCDYSLVTTELIHIVVDAINTNWTRRMIRNRLHETHES